MCVVEGIPENRGGGDGRGGIPGNGGGGFQEKGGGIPGNIGGGGVPKIEVELCRSQKYNTTSFSTGHNGRLRGSTLNMTTYS